MNNKVNHYQQARFSLGAHRLDQLPEDGGIEVAFAGRSNAGKSSALNRISAQKNLARTSKTPGRTQQINIFELDPSRRIADLPGYGYAKVPEKVKRHWQHTLELYLRQRQSLRGLILLMDIRHPLTEFDGMMLTWCGTVGMPVHILLTKADKLKRGPGMAALQKLRAQLKTDYPQAGAQLFSATKGTGVEEARALLDAWFGFDEEEAAAPAP